MKKVRKLSIVIPVYNEEKTIGEILKRVAAADLGKIKKEIIVVNDGSTDGTEKVLEKLKKNKGDFKLINHKRNKGKGSALRTGFKKVTGDVVVIQDGDNEYDPNDFGKMLEKMSEDGVRVVYGSRRLEKKNKKYSGLNFYAGGLILTHLTNMLYGSRITDEPTCYKMFETKLLRSLNLKARRFEFCPEVTAKVLKKGVKIVEVPILYNPRHANQGKKIKWPDFVEGAWTLISQRFKK